MLELSIDESREMIRRISKFHSLNADCHNMEYLIEHHTASESEIESIKIMIGWRYVALQQLLRMKNKINPEKDMNDKEYVECCIRYYRKNGDISLETEVQISDYYIIIQAGKKLKSADITNDKDEHFKKLMKLKGKILI